MTVEICSQYDHPGSGITFAIYEGWGDYSFSRGIVNVGDAFVSNGDFWKIRDLSLGYDFGQKVLKSTKVVEGGYPVGICTQHVYVPG